MHWDSSPFFIVCHFWPAVPSGVIKKNIYVGAAEYTDSSSRQILAPTSVYLYRYGCEYNPVDENTVCILHNTFIRV